MNRRVVYPGELPASLDILDPQVFSLEAMSNLAWDVLLSGLNPSTTTAKVLAAGFKPAFPGGMQVSLEAGRIYSLLPIDATGFGSSGVNNRVVLQQGQADALTLTHAAAPATAGQSRIDLVQVALVQQDENFEVLPYYNSANPEEPLPGPDGSGEAQPIDRKVIAQVTIKQGTAAASPVAPSPDAGKAALFYVTIAQGTTVLSAGNVTVPANAAFIGGLTNQHHTGAPGAAPKIVLGTETQGNLPAAQLPPSTNTAFAWDNTNYRLGIGVASPTFDLQFSANAARTIGLNRHSTTNTAGNNLTIQAGGATVSATDKTGGDLILKAGVSTGTGASNIRLFAAAAGTAGTGDRNPAEVVTILGSGDVGIGATSPSHRLHVAGIGRFVSASPTLGANSQLIVDDNSALAANIGGSLVFRSSYITGDTGSMFAMGGVKSGKTNATTLDTKAYIGLWARGSGGLFEGLRLADTGYVGIGDTNPSERLTVAGGGLFSATLKVNADNTHIQLQESGVAKWNVESSSGNGSMFRITEVGVASQFVLKQGGNVGIGTTAPQKTLVVQAGTDVDTQLVISRNRSAVAYAKGMGIVWQNAVSGHASGAANTWALLQGKAGTDTNNLILSYTGSELVQFTPDGKLGVGTSPSYPIHVYATSGTTNGRVRIENVGTTSSDQANLEFLSGGTSWQIFQRGHEDTLHIYSGTYAALPGAAGIPVASFAADGSTSLRDLFFPNAVNSYRNRVTPSVYGSSTVTGGVYPFNTNGHLVLEPRLSGTICDIVMLGSGGAPIAVFKGGGNLGIGTTAPSNPLHIINPAGASSIRLSDAGGGGGTFLSASSDNTGALMFGMEYRGGEYKAHSTSASMVLGNGNFLRFYADAGLTDNATFTPTERMRISNVGVGIGETSPGRELHIKGPSSGAQAVGMRVQGNATGGRAYAFVTTAGSHVLGDGKLLIQDDTAALTRIAVDSAGNVGIGTQNPTKLLHLHNADTALAAEVTQAITSPSTSGNVLGAQIKLTKVDTNFGRLGFLVKTTASAADSAGFYTEALSILGSNGNVGIRVSDPSDRLEVDGMSRAYHGFRSGFSGGTVGSSDLWMPIATMTLTQQYNSVAGTIRLVQAGSGGSVAGDFIDVSFQLKQQTVMGGVPTIALASPISCGVPYNNVVLVLTENSATKTEATLYIKQPNTFEYWSYVFLASHVSGGALTPLKGGATAGVASLPAGTQYVLKGEVEYIPRFGTNTTNTLEIGKTTYGGNTGQALAGFKTGELASGQGGALYLQTLNWGTGYNLQTRMTIMGNNGNVGIGTETPVDKLTVAGNHAANVNYGVRIENGEPAGISYQAVALKLKTNAGGGYRASLDYHDGGATKEAIVITPGGLIGIGATSPVSLLHVVGDITVGNNNVGGALNTYNNLVLLSQGATSNANYRASIQSVIGMDTGSAPSNSALQISARHWNGSAYVDNPVAWFTNTGRLGIGVANPLSIYPNGTSWTGIHAYNATNALLMIDGGTLARMHWRDSGTTVDKKNFIAQYNDGKLVFQGLTDALGGQANNLTMISNGNNVMGSETEDGTGAKLQVVGEISEGGTKLADKYVDKILGNAATDPLLARALGLTPKYAVPSRTTVAVGASPHAVAFDGTHIWVSNSGTTTVSKINASTGSVASTITVGTAPAGLAFTGTHMWVANITTNNISKVNVSTNAVDATVTVGAGPRAAVYDGFAVWTANYNAGTVTKVNASTNAVLDTVTVGTSPRALAFDGVNVWVANFGSDTVTKIDTSTNFAYTAITVGDGPSAIAFDGAHIWVANSNAGTLSKIEPTSGTVVATVTVPNGVTEGIAFDGTHIWVANSSSDTISKIDIDANAVVTRVAAGTQLRNMAFDGTYMWVANFTSNTASRIKIRF